MGVSSSQPIPSSQVHRFSLSTARSGATTSLANPTPRCSPTMDDEAASQQLMNEARATTHSADYGGPAIPLNLGGVSQATAKKSPESSKKKTRRLGRTQIAQRDTFCGPSIATYSLQDLQDFVGTSPSKSRATRSTMPSTQIEVPDSQVEMQANGEPALTQSTTSQNASPDVSKKHSKRGKKNKNVQPEMVLNSSNAIPATPYEGPAEEAMPSSEHGNTPDAEELPLTPRDLFDKLNAERLQNSSSASQVQSPIDAQEDATERTNDEAATADAAVTADTPETSRSKRTRTRKGKEVAETQDSEQEASTPSAHETSSQPFTYMDDDAEGASSRGESSATGAKRARYSVGGIVTKKRRRVSRINPNRTYQRARNDNDRTAADKALETIHELSHPPDKRTTGDYTADEHELLRRAIRDFQERNSLDTADLVEIIQWTPRRNQRKSDHQSEAQLKKDSDALWEEVNNAGLLRRPKDVRQHVRTTYHVYHRGQWSREDEEQLRELVNLHPGQWRLIATQLNRLEVDTYNRWKDYVRHGENRIIKRWSVDEEENLVRVLSMVCQRVEDMRAETGKPPLDDYYTVINWHEVCRELNDTRSRLQCQTKWRSMRARVPPATLDVEIKPRKTPPPEEAPAKKKSQKSKAKKSRKSADGEAAVSPPGVDDMLWGDKFDLVAELSEQVTANESTSDDQIVWRDVAKKMDFRWSVRTLRTAFKQLCELVLEDEDVEDEEDLTSRLGLLYNYMKERHRDEIEDRYQSAEEPEVDVEAVPRASSSKKRKRQSGAGSETGSGKKKQSKRALNTAESFKSRELVTDSEPEL